MPDSITRLNQALEGRYRIERELGEGGMATVYLAEDLKHKRKVAVKVLRPELAAVLGADRFVQEIETTAGFQHPHILPLFDSGQADGFLYYVMPYVEGDTLRDKLDRKTQLGIDEGVRIACEVADALDSAHKQGVIHRDIKPENVLLQDGRALVADFGIALAVSAAGGGRMTETGLSLGTPHYMSPEQATAEKDLTVRADIYSLGSMLYEMLAGSPPHVGASAQQIIMKIVTEEAAPVRSVRKTVPPNVAAAVARSLEKLPADRFESARAFADALRDPAFGAARSASEHAAGSGARSGVPVPIATGVLLVLLGLSAWGWLRPSPPPAVKRYGLALPSEQAPLFYATPIPLPDGSLVYLGPDAAGGGSTQLWRKLRDAYEAVPIEGTLGTTAFAVSHDGADLLIAGLGPRRVPVVGGSGLPLTNWPRGQFRGQFAWLSDGSLVGVVRGPPEQLVRISFEGGDPEVLYSAEGGRTLSAATEVQGAGIVLFEACTEVTTGGEGCSVYGLDLENLEARVLAPGRWPQFAPTGHLLYWAGGSVFAAPLDLDRIELSGTAVPVLTSVASMQGSYQLSRSGTLVMRTAGSTRRLRTMVWMDRAGRETPVDANWSFDPTVSGGNEGWALSPDGSRVAIGLVTELGEDIWVKQLEGGRLTRVTLEEGLEARPRWTPDGESITYVVGAVETPGLYERRVDGTGSPRLLFPGTVSEGVWHPDEEWLLLRHGVAGPTAGGRDITGFRPGVDTAAVPLLASRFDESALMPSPDGRWMAYQSDEAGVVNVFVVPFPETSAGKWQVSTAGGQGPLWSRDGSELYYVSPDDEMMAVPVTTSGSTLELGQPVALFPIPEALLGVESGRFYTQWDVAEDGRFIMTKRVDDVDQGAVVVVENYLEELKARTGG